MPAFITEYPQFFTATIIEWQKLLEPDKYKDIITSEDITDAEFKNEVLADSTINLIDVTCFDCDEGGSTIGYSRKQNKVVTLFEHD